MKGATTGRKAPLCNRLFQSTLPMKGATYEFIANTGKLKFQSTLPMKGATSWQPLSPIL